MYTCMYMYAHIYKCTKNVRIQKGGKSLSEGIDFTTEAKKGNLYVHNERQDT